MAKYVSIIACSGPGSLAAIRGSEIISYFCAGVGAVILLAIAYDTLKRGQRRLTLPAAVLLLAIHPAWTISAHHGDCGGLKDLSSRIFTAFFIALFVYQHFTAESKR